jgi:hypothetical protein
LHLPAPVTEPHAGTFKAHAPALKIAPVIHLLKPDKGTAEATVPSLDGDDPGNILGSFTSHPQLAEDFRRNRHTD